MGRYYTTNTGRSGKFGFAVQSSDDPEIFGMEENTGVIHYYMDDSEENLEQVEEVMNKQYDILNIPKEERIYSGKENDLYQLIEKYKDQNWMVYNEERDGKQIPYHSEEHPEGLIPKQGVILAECRLYLGLTIMTDLKEQGYCELEAEC